MKGPFNLQNFKNDCSFTHQHKKFPRKKFSEKRLIYKRNLNGDPSKRMKLEFDEFEKDLMVETIQHRLDTDKILIINSTLKEELEDLLRKIEDDEYV